MCYVRSLNLHNFMDTNKKTKITLQIMAKKSVITGEYIVSVLESGSIEVYRIYDNVKGALREIAEKEGFEYDSNWTTRQFGAKLIDFVKQKKGE